MNWADKSVLVCGMARSGQSSARLLHSLGTRVTAQDLKEADKLEWDFDPASLPIEWYLGKNPDEIVERFDLIVVSPGIPFGLPFMEKARVLGIPVWGELELAYRLCPSSMTVIAVTGTNGKTTTTTLVGEMLARVNPQTVVAGNIGLPLTECVQTLTPESAAVVEVSSFQLETAHTFRPRISAILNITPDHLNRHKTMEVYSAVKARIFENQRPGDAVVLNYDDPLCRAMRPPCRAVYFSVKEPLEEGVFLEGSRIRARFSNMDGLSVPFDTVVADVSSVRTLPENALAAVAMALLAGVPVETIGDTLRAFKGVEHRVEYVAALNDVEFYNDSKATNTDSAVKALEAMKRPVVLIGGGYDKQADFGSWVGLFPGKVKRLIVMGATADQIVETCRAFSFEAYERVNSLRDAVSLAFARAEPGDCVLLSPACASWDMFDNYEQRGRLFKQFVADIAGKEDKRDDIRPS